jgi:hypothetical protein
MEERLDERDERAGLRSLEATPASVELDPENEPVLGPLGQRLLVIGLIIGVIVFLAVMTWFLGYLAYTTPPVPGSG